MSKDEIDASKCKYYTNNDRECIAEGEDVPLDCNCINDCYYKQLQQLKQENEELRKKLSDLICSANCYQYKRAEKLQQKLEKIKEYILQENKANRDLNENGDFIYGTILQIIEEE